MTTSKVTDEMTSSPAPGNLNDSSARQAGDDANESATAADNATAMPPREDRRIKRNQSGKGKKVKLIRGRFAMPASEYDLIGKLKKRCVANGLAVKKRELLRAAIVSFSALGDAAVRDALAKIDLIKNGRSFKQVR
jgi:translation initiation factor 1 (eIF-1/SUI1)